MSTDAAGTTTTKRIKVYVAGPYRAPTAHEVHRNIEVARRYGISLGVRPTQSESPADEAKGYSTGSNPGIGSPERRESAISSFHWAK